jgi:hypothetical protein
VYCSVHLQKNNAKTLYTCVHVFVYMFVFFYMCVCVFKYLCVYVCVNVCACMCVNVCACMCVCVRTGRNIVKKHAPVAVRALMAGTGFFNQRQTATEREKERVCMRARDVRETERVSHSLLLSLCCMRARDREL